MSASTELTAVPVAHPCAGALRLASGEMEMGRGAIARGNEGQGRVCGRRAVGIFIQTIAPILPIEYGPHAMANLRTIESNTSLPHEIRAAAGRLLGGARSIARGESYSPDPLADAALIINHFVAAAS